MKLYYYSNIIMIETCNIVIYKYKESIKGGGIW